MVVATIKCVVVGDGAVGKVSISSVFNKCCSRRESGFDIIHVSQGKGEWLI